MPLLKRLQSLLAVITGRTYILSTRDTSHFLVGREGHMGDTIETNVRNTATYLRETARDNDAPDVLEQEMKKELLRAVREGFTVEDSDR